MWLTKFIAKLTKSPEQNPIKLKTVKDLQLMDDIWIKLFPCFICHYCIIIFEKMQHKSCKSYNNIKVL